MSIEDIDAMAKPSKSKSDDTQLRARAEEKVKAQPGKKSKSGPSSKSDLQRVLHELQVHQVELEMQNDELKEARQQADDLLEKYTTLYDFAPVGYFSLDEKGVILEVNLTGAAMLGHPRSKLTGRRFEMLVKPEGRPAFQNFLESIFSGYKKQTCEASLLHAEHGSFWADLQILSVMIADGSEQWCPLAVIDISARKQAEERQRRIDAMSATNQKLEEEIVRRRSVEADLRDSEQHSRHMLEESQQLQKKLRDLTHQNLTSQDNLRKEISRTLHDEISQLLMGIDLQLETLANSDEITEKGIRRKLAPVRRLVKNSVDVVHKLSLELRPVVLDHLGLIPAIRSEIKDIARRKDWKIHFSADSDAEDLDQDKRTTLFRVIQEALTNTSKHGRAKEVKVTLTKVSSGISLEIVDDGKGFDVDRFQEGKMKNHLGLTSMRERVEMVGGRFNVVSARGSGTTILAVVPLGKK